jgi:geranylgeranyl diphosphate synthase type II
MDGKPQDARSRIETALHAALALADHAEAPPKLAAAMRHAVFPGGARIRPRLTMAVAMACRTDSASIAASAAAAIELLHCASLVHDDMPEFDNARTRRGRPSVFAAYGASLALLTGDALIVLAFQALADGAAKAPTRLAAMVHAIAGAVGVPHGIVAGQAWECEEAPDLAAYQQAKTGALFAAATEAGAAAAGWHAAPWRPLGAYLGEAYQVADDIRDAVSTEAELGKPVGQDAALGRPNAVHQLGLSGALARLNALAAMAAASIPPCPGATELKLLIRMESQRLLPKELSSAQAA